MLTCHFFPFWITILAPLNFHLCFIYHCAISTSLMAAAPLQVARDSASSSHPWLWLARSQWNTYWTRYAWGQPTWWLANLSGVEEGTVTHTHYCSYLTLQPPVDRCFETKLIWIGFYWVNISQRGAGPWRLEVVSANGRAQQGVGIKEKRMQDATITKGVHKLL
jgi:hypothetical protein